STEYSAASPPRRPSDLDTGASTELGELAELAPISSQALGGVAALSNGDLAITARQLLTTDEAALAVCREAADRLGLDGYDNAPRSEEHTSELQSREKLV